jgi:16S rRNA (cytosine967-C5)-methyltransferase
MNDLPFRTHHLLELLFSYENQNLPLDLCIHHYFKSHHALGSKDRGFIAEAIYGMVRWRALLDYLIEEPADWTKRWELWDSFQPDIYRNEAGIPDHIRVSFPKYLHDLLIESHGKERAEQICWDCNFPAPTTVRVNTLKTTREEMLQKWENDYEVSPCVFSKEGIRFHQKINFFQLPEFKKGMFEVQDEGSQLLAKLVKAAPGHKVLDYCSGSGGKTLAFAPAMEGKGQIYLHDIRAHILTEAKRRLKRAGIQNAQPLLPDSSKKGSLKKKFDWVLVDAPCTGTGTLRRNPDMKWKFSEEMLLRLVGQQRTIFEQALSYVRPGGRIVYGTCSILKQENRDQITHFLNTYPLRLEGEIFESLPKINEMDGLFGACLIKTH